MVPEIISSSLERSAMAARGRPQLATGPQKCVDCESKNKVSVNELR